MKRLFKGGAGRRSRASGSRGKISEALLEFSRPLLDDIPDDAPIEVVRTAVDIAVAAWNAVVLSRQAGTSEALETVRATICAGYPSELLSLFESLVERKTNGFRDDPRHILWHEVYRSKDGLHLNAMGLCSAEEEPRAAEARRRHGGRRGGARAGQD